MVPPTLKMLLYKLKVYFQPALLYGNDIATDIALRRAIQLHRNEDVILEREQKE